MPKPIAPPKRFPGWRVWFRVAAWCGVAAILALGANRVNAFLIRDPHFRLTHLDIKGAVYTSRARIGSMFAGDVGKSVAAIPLDERRRRLLALDWVEAASLTRIWPDRIVATISERRPVAFAKIPVAGTLRYRLGLIDKDGVLLPLPPRVRFRLPVLSGITEQQTEAERATRVHALQRLLADLGPLANGVSEVNAASTDDLRVITAMDHRAVELFLGDHDFRTRYQNFLDHYAEIHRTSEQASVFDLRFDDRILAK